MPRNANSYSEWNATRYLNWAKQKGKYVYEVIYNLFAGVRVEQTYYNTVHSILKLADTYSDQRLDNACHILLEKGIHPSFSNIKDILLTKKDLCQENKDDKEETTIFTRGGDYFDYK